MGKQLNSKHRQKIAELLQEGKNFREIAETLKVDRTTILREINRNAGDNGVYNPQLAESKTRRRKKLQAVSPGAVARLPPNVRAEVEKVWAFETPAVKRRQLIVDKYIKEYGPVIEQKLISPRAAMCALLKREGIYRDAAHPVCLSSSIYKE